MTAILASGRQGQEDLLQLQGQKDLNSEFQAGQGYTGRPYFKRLPAPTNKKPKEGEINDGYPREVALLGRIENDIGAGEMEQRYKCLLH